MTRGRPTPRPPAGSLDRVVLVAHLASGAIWIAGFSVAAHGAGVLPTATALAYVLLGSLARSGRGRPPGRALVVCWAVAVLLGVALLAPAGWAAPALGAPVGSVLFGAWAVTGAFLTQVLTGGHALDPSRDDGP